MEPGTSLSTAEEGGRSLTSAVFGFIAQGAEANTASKLLDALTG